MLINKKYGFTLIELLVVIAIFALIANVTMISLNKAKKDARDAKRVDNISQIRSALHLYSVDKLAYPATVPIDATIALGTGSNLVLDSNGWSDGTSPTSPIFMYSVPRDPKMINVAANPCQGADTNPCDYSYTQNGNDFILYFYLEGAVSNLAAGAHYASKDEVH
ncbi:hypothetical protein A3B87_02850 [Candidatus Kuenenbacteria bacterium RIFCSPHIGHO2_02_FULL_39_13]|uniref:Type II secretion system protein GspG C-terminal domain-containing protein n=1 Tax=Candidatus Kuenenbacteria bacterium RIFCSPHIGHO2_02_FULL_39_13 TaxID=1798561 RepID=A0A1F6FNV2_9BACT|nr:MAG: hypothetical protein A3B87_02850 [Candidatus Kuenenbacteria bacterium RIFCSPHIGHO2_02_FULL_39_13]